MKRILRERERRRDYLAKFCNKKYDLDIKPVKHSCPMANQADLSEIGLSSMAMKVNTYQV